ncbi:MAG: RagB/SusD family nutrient uptake outer membrane protein [Ignavibacteriae bacterium]|nr:RagB/SusD family nutrient uptake outer membrane protein [Ignavibacteriota bacterium]MCB9211444.1 RagB/SusD family nutrient uptake outer membrane protein [Ignavibacteriales bacterium]MCB9258493.1 RagB/SusD family nutrient uptake outer membrane protein [Ignavibacteriales bacterium]
MMIFNKMKKIILLFFLAMWIISCSDDFLDVTDPNNLTPDTFWKTEQDAIKAITGTYALFQYQVWSGRWGFYEIRYMNFECRSDLINLYDMWSPFGDMSRYNASSTSYSLNDFWSFSYQALYAANQVIENVPGMGLNNGSVFVAEAKFLRAYAHYLLVTNFGNIVLRTSTPKTSEDFYLGQSPQEEVWTQIENDLVEAKASLPLSWESQWLGRATKGAASALLAKTYLWQNKWGQAEGELREIVNSGIYSLVDDYESLFNGLNEHNSESIFELNFTMNNDGGRNERNSFPAMQTDWKMSTPNEYMRNLYLNDKTDAGELSKRVTGSLIYSDLENDDLSAISWKKFSLHDDATNNGFDFSNSGTNFTVIRYADVLLMLAEALNEQGNTSEAENFVNQVRARAVVPNISGMNQEQLREHIRHVERPLELAAEADRFYDLVRWYKNGDLSSVLVAHGREAGETFDNSNDLYYPIPSSETTSNPLVVQNPGY